MIPRPAIVILASYGAGLAAGLLHFWVLGFAALAGLAIWRGAPPWVRLALLMAAGGQLGALACVARDARQCTSRFPFGALAATVRVLEPTDSDGGMVRAAPLRAGCAGTVDVRLPAGRLRDAGDVLRVEGRWVPRTSGVRPEGLLLVRRDSLLQRRPSSGARLRTWISRTSARLYGGKAGLVDALVLNRRGGMTPEVRERYAASGLVHILSISGFHVGLIAGWVYLVARALGARRERALMIAAALSTGYVAFLGWPAPATRAAWLAVLLALARVRQRQVQPDVLLAVSCLGVLLVDPWAVFDLGAWLSASALWGATTFVRWSDRAWGRGQSRQMLFSSLGATAATAPLTAGALGSVALVGIGLNFIAIPLAAVAVPAVIASLLLASVAPPAANLIAAGGGLGLAGLDLLAAAGSRLPWGHVVQPGGLGSAAPWVALLGVLL